MTLHQATFAPRPASRAARRPWRLLCFFSWLATSFCGGWIVFMDRGFCFFQPVFFLAIHLSIDSGGAQKGIHLGPNED